MSVRQGMIPLWTDHRSNRIQTHKNDRIAKEQLHAVHRNEYINCTGMIASQFAKPQDIHQCDKQTVDRCHKASVPVCRRVRCIRDCVHRMPDQQAVDSLLTRRFG